MWANIGKPDLGRLVRQRVLGGVGLLDVRRYRPATKQNAFRAATARERPDRRRWFFCRSLAVAARMRIISVAARPRLDNLRHPVDCAIKIPGRACPWDSFGKVPHNGKGLTAERASDEFS